MDWQQQSTGDGKGQKGGRDGGGKGEEESERRKELGRQGRESKFNVVNHKLL